MCLRMYCKYLIYLCALMQFFKTNIFGVLALLVGMLLLLNTFININEIQSFNAFQNVGEYVAVKTSMEPNLYTGSLRLSLMFLLFLLIPVVLSIVHKRKKGNKIILYSSIIIILINFLVYPYFLTLLSNTINTI